MNLEEQKCEACRSDSPKVTKDEADKLLESLVDWQIIEDSGVQKLIKSFSFKGFMNAMKFADHVAYISEKDGHHPQLIVDWGKTTVIWWTHKIDGLHKNDFIMAAKTDTVFNATAK